MFRSVRLAVLGAGVVVAVIAPTGLAQAHGASCTVTAAAAAIDSEEQQFLTLINNYRLANGRAALTISHNATRAASWFSWDMATDNYAPADHVDSNTRGTQARITWCGVNWSTWSENIYWGNGTAQAAFDWWKNSPVHNTNMLAANVNRIGIARHYNPASTFGWYWTTDFVTETASTGINGFAWYDNGATTKSGTTGTAVRAYATGAVPNETYQLVLATGDCDAIAAVLNFNVRTASSTGVIGQTGGAIPSGVPNGNYVVCFKTTANRTNADATVPVGFTKS